MFKDIRNRITTINAITLITFFSVFLILLSIIFNWSLVSSSQTYLKEAAADIISESENDDSISFNSALNERLGYDYLIWNTNDAIEAQNINNSALIEQAFNLLKDDPDKESFGSLNVGNQDYRVFTMPFLLNGTQYRLQVFRDTTSEKTILTYFLAILLIFGLIGIILLIGVSYFLSGRSLIRIKENFENQKEFIANASHELRSPLTVIQTNLNVLEYKEDETIAQNMKWIDNINSECENMRTLLSELLQIAQNDDQKVEYQDQEINLSALVNEITDLMGTTAQENSLYLDSQVDPDISYIGDPDKFKQVLRIFIDNAIKYTPKEGMIQLALNQNPDSIDISIQDNGIGISEEDSQHIFERFYRCDNSRTKQTGGSGLGLNIAQSIVEHYKGKILVDSTIGKGSTFTIKLPKL